MSDLNEYINQLYTSHKEELYRHVCTKFGLDSAESEDIVQMTFTKFSDLENAREIKNPRAYLFKMAHNLVIDQKRADKKFEYYEPDEDIQDEQDQTLHDPARIHGAQQELELMQKAIGAMPDQRRQLLKMSRFENLSNTEIARRKGISEAAVRKNIARALLDIKRALASTGGETD